MKTDEALAAENAVAEKLASVGADTVRRSTHQAPLEPAGAPEPTPEPEPQAQVEDETPAEPAAEAAAETPSAGDDPAISAYLKKYGGDVNKALQAAVSAQRKLGEIGSELGQTRQQNAELEQIITRLDAMEQRAAQPAAPSLPDQATIDWLDEQITVNPAAAQGYAVQALNAGQTVLYDRIMRQWYDNDPYAATNFSNAIRFEQVKQELQAAAPVRDENTAMQAAVSQVLSEHPEFTQYTDNLAAVIERYPAAASGLQGSQEQKQQAIETLFALAERDTLRAIALTGGPAAEAATTHDVVTAATSQDPPTEAPAEPTPLDKWREQFRQEAEKMRGGAFVAR